MKNNKSYILNPYYTQLGFCVHKPHGQHGCIQAPNNT